VGILDDLSRTMIDTSLCGLGSTAPNPVLSTLRYFRDEYETHIKDRRCPARVCKALVTYAIDPEKCTGCGACLRACPANAIMVEKKEAHRLDVERCVKCGACYQACKFEAVSVQ
jgi:NADH-quinone oxidoreductase subunit F